MLRYLLLAAAVFPFGSPAFARDGSPYVGVEAGLLFPRDGDIDLIEPGGTNNDADIDYSRGHDIDLVAGYDFGAFRTEAELAHKRASHDEYTGENDFRVDADGRTKALSLMANVLFDIGSDQGLNFFVGGGAGLARTKVRLRYIDDGEEFDGSAKDTRFAWQILAGLRYPVSSQVDVGLKYRYFDSKLKDDNFVEDISGGTDALRTDFRSHSILASLIFNFGGVP